MAKEKRVKMYNKGTRNWTFKDNGKEVTCAPGKSIELNESQAKKFVKNYPHDFLAGEPVQKGNDNKKLKSEVAKLTAENEAAKGGLEKLAELEKKVSDYEALTANNEKLKSEVADLKKALEEATKPKE